MAIPRRGSVPEKGYESVSLPSQLLDLVRAILKENPELGYGSMSEYVKEAVRDSFLGHERILSKQSLEESFAKKHGKTPREVVSEHRKRAPATQEPDAADRVLAALRFAIDELPLAAEDLRPVLEGVRRSLSRIVVHRDDDRATSRRR